MKSLSTKIPKQNVEIRSRSWWKKCLNFVIPPPPKILKSELTT